MGEAYTRIDLGALDAPRITILAYDGVDELDLFGLYSLLAKAGDKVGCLRLISTDSLVTSSGGVQFLATPLAQITEQCDAMVIPGGSGAKAVAATQLFQSYIQAAHANGTRFFSCCSGSLILAAALGLRTGRVAVHKLKRDELARWFEGEIVAGFVNCNGIASIGGETSRVPKSIELGFHLLSQICPDLACEISRRTEIQWEPR